MFLQITLYDPEIKALVYVFPFNILDPTFMQLHLYPYLSLVCVHHLCFCYG